MLLPTAGRLALFARIEDSDVAQPVFNRPDTLLGVCEALGQDFGFNPLWLRIALAVGVLWNPFAMIGGYVTLAAVLVVARWLTPVREVTKAEPFAPVAADNDAVNDGGQIMLAEAA